MDVHSDFVEPATPAISYDNVSFWRTEDSGYHTSFTPGSMECSELSNENVDPSLVQTKICITGQIHVDCYDITPEVNFRLCRKCGRSKGTHTPARNESLTESPTVRRGVKRSYQDDSSKTDTRYNSIPTPTSAIAGGIQRLKVNDNNKLTASFSVSPVNSQQKCTANDICQLEEYAHPLSFPTTPVKKICRTSCKLSPSSRNGMWSPLRAIDNVCPPRKSIKKINFAIHSLSCESQGLQPTLKRRPQSKVVRNIQFRPYQKVDIIKMLYQKVVCMPAIMKIFSYLSSEDIFNFSLVSPIWLQVCEDVSKAKTKKQEYLKSLKRSKENKRNRDADTTLKSAVISHNRSLKEIHNVMSTNTASPDRSPPGTPRSIRFNRFTKSASLDSRIQISCVRCCQPAKVTEECSGEVWAECTSTACSYRFCKYCQCERHPGKRCFQYDLEGPSPSKRKKKESDTCIVGTKKSRKNLRRLL